MKAARIPTRTDTSAIDFARLFFENIECEYGTPTSVVSDKIHELRTSSGPRFPLIHLSKDIYQLHFTTNRWAKRGFESNRRRLHSYLLRRKLHDLRLSARNFKFKHPKLEYETWELAVHLTAHLTKRLHQKDKKTSKTIVFYGIIIS